MRLARAKWLAGALLLVPALASGAQSPTSRPPVTPAAAGDGAQIVRDALASWDGWRPGASPQAALRVNAMPSTYGADTGSPQPASWIGRDNILWGNVTGGTAPYTYTVAFDDGSPAASGAVADRRYIVVHHSYTTLGPKFVTLTVQDNVGATDTETFRIDVGPYGIQSRVQAAIEDGLRYLYLTQLSSGRWNAPASEGIHALAFQLRNHDKSANPTNDIYAETLQAFWNNIFSSMTRFPIGAQPAGNPDTNGNGYSLYANGFTQCYNHGILMLAMAGIKDLNEVVTVGSEAGRTIKDVLQDMIDLAAYSQTETGVERGGWRYTLVTSNSGSDNSAVQWVVLGMVASEGRGLTIPAFVKTELEIWTLYSQGADGGFGYTDKNFWNNIAKTGSGLMQLAWLHYAPTSAQVLAAANFLNAHWTLQSDNFGYAEMFYTNEYAMYAVKKGLESFSPPISFIAAHDWQDEFNKTLVYDALSDYDGVGGIAYNNDFNEQIYGTGDLVDGRWTSSYWLGSNDYSLVTAARVLTLTAGVSSLVPVANCTVTPPSAGPGVTITLDGTGSFHQDPNHEIVQYLWDFDASNGVNFAPPDGVGSVVTTSYSLGVGELSRTFTVTLLVRDNAVPPVERQTTCRVVISRENHPPVAVPGGPYAACVGQRICVDGSGSYDPDAGDFVAEYHWDLDGDGQFDDFDGPATCVTFPGLYDGFIGLQVVDSFGVPSQNSGAVVRIFTALGDLSTADSDLVVDSDAGCVQGGQTCVTGTYRVLSDDPTYVVAAARVDFFLDDPTNPVNRIATFTDNNLVGGMTLSHQACFNRPDNLAHAVFMVLDPNQVLNECVETDNVAVHRFACGCDAQLADLALVGYETVSWDPGTLIWEVRVSIKNNGPGTAHDVNATLMEDIPWVTPVDGASSYGDIASGDTKFGDSFTLDLTGRPGAGGFNVFFDVFYTDNCQTAHEVRLDPEAVTPGENGRSALRTYALSQNSPNPFNPRTMISFTLANPGHVKLEVFDLRGRLVKTLVDANLAATQHSVDWDGTDLTGQPVSSGLYYYRLNAADFSQTLKMTLVK